MHGLYRTLSLTLLVVFANGQDDADYNDNNAGGSYYNNGNNQNYANGNYNLENYQSNTYNGTSYYSGNPCNQQTGYYDEDGNYVEEDQDGNEGEAENDAECEEYDEKTIGIQNCENSVVQVTSVKILCDSPYTYYYGNNAHRNSQLCDYGDKAMVTVYFNVTEDLNYNEDIFMTFGIYAWKTQLELVYAVRAVEVCSTFVGHQCRQAGSYAFAFQVTFDYAYGDRSQFIPKIEMGFSNKADEGYNLGGVNIFCQYDGNYQQYDPWFDGKQFHASQTWGAGAIAGVYATKYGVLVGVLLLLIAFGIFAWKRMGTQIEVPGSSDDLLGSQKDDENASSKP
jgi:hypothetical protein